DHPATVVLALDDSDQALPAHAKVGPLVTGAAEDLNVIAKRFEELGDELLEPFGGERGKLSELQVDATGLAALPLIVLAAVAHRVADRPRVGFDPRALGSLESLSVPLDLVERVVDRVIEPRSLGTCQLILIPPEHGELQVLHRAGQLRGGLDRRSVIPVRDRAP